jgi:hypothetical protein
MTEGTINVNITLTFDPEQLKVLLTTLVVLEGALSLRGVIDV